MSYADFSLESVEASFGLTLKPGVLFPTLAPVAVPDWLRDTLKRGRESTALVSEKGAVGETLVFPILLAAREFIAGKLAIFSGQRLDVDPARGLTGECDFIIARTEAVPRLRAPLMTVLEAKKGDVEAGLGQCVAQIVGARLFKDRAGEPPRPLYGCVTTGDDWQFLRLDAATVLIDPNLLFIDNVGGILATLRAMLSDTPGGT